MSTCTCGHQPYEHYASSCSHCGQTCGGYRDAEAEQLRARVTELEAQLARENLAADMWMIRASAHESRVVDLESALDEIRCLATIETVAITRIAEQALAKEGE